MLLQRMNNPNSHDVIGWVRRPASTDTLQADLSEELIEISRLQCWPSPLEPRRPSVSPRLYSTTLEVNLIADIDSRRCKRFSSSGQREFEQLALEEMDRRMSIHVNLYAYIGWVSL